MTQPDPNAPPAWYNEPPEWVKTLNQRPAPSSVPPRSGGYESGRQDQEMLTAIHAMPEQVVNALREAIQAVTPQPSQQQQTPTAPPAANPPGEEKKENESDSAPKSKLSFGERWMTNQL